jgi:hypothetical protein
MANVQPKHAGEYSLQNYTTHICYQMHLTITWECVLYLNTTYICAIFVSLLNYVSHITKGTKEAGSVFCTLQNKFSYNVQVSLDSVFHTTDSTLKMLGVSTVCYKN